MGLFGGKKKDGAGQAAAGAAGRKPITEAPQSTRKSVRRVVPKGAAGAKPVTQRVAPQPKAVAAVDPLVDEVQLPPAIIDGDADQLDLGSGSHPVQSEPVAPPPRQSGTAPILASAAPDFGGSLDAVRGGGPSRSGDQVLIEFLIGKSGLMTPDQATAARAKAEAEGLPLDSAAVAMGLITEEQLVNSLSQETWVPHLKVDKYEIRKKALDTVARDDAQHFGVFPVDKLGNLLTLAMVNPLDVEAIRQLEAKTGLDIKKVVATRSEIATAIDKYYGGKAVASEGSRSFSQDVSDAPPKSATQMLSQGAPAAQPPVVPVAPLPSLDLTPPKASAVVPDISADIQDIDDLLGGDETIAPAIIEPVSIKPEESNDALELTDAPITQAIHAESELEFGLQDAPKQDTGALARSALDLEKTDAIVPPPVVAPVARPRRSAEGRPATARIAAGNAGPKVVNLVPVLEEEFRYAISHGKSKVFERWVALQSRNRIINAVSVEKDLDPVLAQLYAAPRKAG
ncbi:MAG: hypothetical protein J0M02_07660 [Planctomycetes bacterium]|nr:hypothetical protein [Planctomycetota bacterium]